MADIQGVYLFKSLEDVETALLNWLGERMDETKAGTLLRIDSEFISSVETGAGYEVRVTEPIPPEAIKVLNTDI